MKVFKRIVLVVSIVTFCHFTQLVKAEFDFDYFGQEPPGMEIKRFNPRIEGAESAEVDSLHFTPDGNECYLIMKTNDVSEVFLTKKEDGVWSAPGPAQFADGATMIHGFSPDGNRLYFPIYEPSDNFEQSGVYVRTRTADGWSRGERLPEPVNLDHANRVIGMSVGAYEDLYFCTWRQPCLGQCDVWVARNVNGAFPVTENLRVLNTNTSECMIISGPNDCSLVFYSWRPGGFGQADLYYSYPIGDTWAVPRNLGPRVNTYNGEVPQTFSPDYKYMFFHRYRGEIGGLYWIATKAILPIPDGPVKNLNSEQQFGSLQSAIDYANTGDEIVLEPGIYQGNINFNNKNLIIRSSEPNNPEITAQTIIQAELNNPAVILSGNSSLKGLSITGGSTGVVCEDTQNSISMCNITQNQSDGIQVSKDTHLEMNNSIIAANKGAGIRILRNKTGRTPTFGLATITNCTIVQNSEAGIIGGDSTITNSIIYFNGTNSNITQIDPHSTGVTYSCIQNGWTGQGNINSDPSFLQIGHRTDANDPNSEWVSGDYHLSQESPCIDAGNPSDAVGLEPSPNGDVINTGAYGGTQEACTTREYLRFLWQTPALLRTPESVIYDEQRNILYVSNYNVRGGFTQSGDRSPDEFISKVSLTGEIVELRWVTGLVSPTGIAIYQDKLYAVERDHLAEIDIETAQIVNRYSLEVARFPNDIIFDNNGTGYISDNSQSANTTIYRFVDGQIEPWLNRSQLRQPNGLCWDQDRLVALDSGSMYLKGIRPSDENVMNIVYLGNNINAGGLGDGLKVVDADTYLISDWGGIVFLAEKTGDVKQILDLRNTTPVAGSSVNSADIEYIPQQKLLIIPTFNDHRLIAYELLD